MKYIVFLFLLTISCQISNPGKSVAFQQQIKKIDFHTHYNYPRTYLDSLLAGWNMQTLLVDVSTADSNGINRRWELQMENFKQLPNRFFLCTSFEGSGIDDPDFAQKTIRQIRHEIDQGARMVKVWKNFGMVTKDASGRFIQIDDPRLQPIWDFLVQNDIPVLAHIGEPVQAWRALDDPQNPHFGYYSDHPQYHAFLHPEIPQWETIIAARDSWIESNPDLIIVGAHMGSMSHDVGLVAERLEKFPNFHAETAARFGDLAGQESSIVRDFIIRFQDRILFGTDFGTSHPEVPEDKNLINQEAQRLSERIALRWEYLSGADSLVIRNQKSQGLHLPESVLRKIFYENAAKILQLKS